MHRLLDSTGLLLLVRARLWANLLGSENTVIEGMDWREEDGGDTDGAALRLIVRLRLRLRPHQRLAHRCGICGKKRPRYDNGQGRRRWEALDLGTMRTYPEAVRRGRRAPSTG